MIFIKQSVFFRSIFYCLFLLLGITVSCKKQIQKDTIISEETTEDDKEVEKLFSIVGAEPQSLLKVSAFPFSAEESVLLSKCNQNAFFLLNDLYNGMNLTISPLSLYYLLSMASSGATGDTQEQIGTMMGFGNNVELAEGFFHKIIENSRQLDLSVKVSVANMFAINKSQGFSVSSSYRNSIATNYESVVAELDFKKRESTSGIINKWVSLHTNGLIDNLVSKENISDAMLAILINTLYCNGQWRPGFLPNSTKPDAFYKENGVEESIDYMNGADYRFFYTSDNYSVLTLNLGEETKHYAFSIVLPKEGKNLGDLLKELSETKWENIIAASNKYYVQTSIPKFKSYSTLSSKETLQRLGVSSIFNAASADFSKMTNGVNRHFYINDLIQKTNLSIDEKGIEASSASSSMFYYDDGSGNKPQVKTIFNANRPFVYVLSDIDSGLIFFIGVFTGAD